MNRILSALILLLTIAACGGSDSPTGPGEGPNNGTFTATIDGQSWTATTIVPTMASASTGTVSAIGAGSPTYTIAFAWVDEGPATYTIGQAVGFNGNLSLSGSHWTSTAVGGTGTLQVTNRTSTQISGTFNFTMLPASGTTGTRTITNGAFTINF